MLFTAPLPLITLLISLLPSIITSPFSPTHHPPLTPLLPYSSTPPPPSPLAASLPDTRATRRPTPSSAPPWRATPPPGCTPPSTQTPPVGSTRVPSTQSQVRHHNTPHHNTTSISRFILSFLAHSASLCPTPSLSPFLSFTLSHTPSLTFSRTPSLIFPSPLHRRHR